MAKKWQIEAKPTWHHFARKINWFRLQTKKKRAQRRAHDMETQDAS
jgi:hypothetical protein